MNELHHVSASGQFTGVTTAVTYPRSVTCSKGKSTRRGDTIVQEAGSQLLQALKAGKASKTRMQHA